MKAKILALIIGLGMGLVFCSCEKDLEKYSGTDYIRFVSVFEKDSVDIISDWLERQRQIVLA